jgi:hypothetical protein
VQFTSECPDGYGVGEVLGLPLPYLSALHSIAIGCPRERPISLSVAPLVARAGEAAINQLLLPSLHLNVLGRTEKSQQEPQNEQTGEVIDE